MYKNLFLHSSISFFIDTLPIFISFSMMCLFHTKLVEYKKIWRHFQQLLWLIYVGTKTNVYNFWYIYLLKRNVHTSSFMGKIIGVSITLKKLFLIQELE